MDLTDKNLPVSIIVPLNISKDDDECYSNTVIMLNYIMKQLDNHTLYVYETSETLCFHHMKIYQIFCIRYFTSDPEVDSNYVTSLDEVIKSISTKVCYIHDINLFLPISSYKYSNMLVENNVFDIVRPYDKKDKIVTINQRERFNIISGILSQETFCISEFSSNKYGCLLENKSITCFNKDVYLSLNLEENFFTKDTEDIHKYRAYYEKEYNVGFLNSLKLYHFETEPSKSIKQITYEKPLQVEPSKTLTTIKFEEVIKLESNDKNELKEDILDIEELSAYLYGSHLTKIKKPELNKCVFAKPDDNKLGICLIEFRKLDWLKYILYQIAHLYGNTDASLYIVHGSKNGNYFKNILNGWSNITFIEYPNDNLNRREYAELCTNPEFYKCFKTKFVLKMEWDSFIRKQIPEHFFKYSYIGAPWNGFPNDLDGNVFNRIGNKSVGNGGFSLRNVKRMIEVCSKEPKPSNMGEDVHISNCLHQSEVPDAKLAQEFAVEHIYNEDPVGLHHVWEVHNVDKITAWFK